jgi:hypothetical protein
MRDKEEALAALDEIKLGASAAVVFGTVGDGCFRSSFAIWDVSRATLPLCVHGDELPFGSFAGSIQDANMSPGVASAFAFVAIVPNKMLDRYANLSGVPRVRADGSHVRRMELK